ncbi:hypothetical protein LTR84_007080 [Exophiala bonariae]|uniref:Zn(2)-C6 fungal-type domain-containing protein n=1 Tax=Exophiala bonariae TaxID=1690606 RepID=A0AAV9N3B4_9EURO|nr:hypothetical protein LTR84_007080 [Exophiala bonariae]
MPSIPIHPKKGRLGSRKSNNGCITCRIRRVKCDEQRPSCQRCVSTGRRCDGYQTTPIRSPSSSATISNQISTIQTFCSVDAREIQAFEYFIYEVVPGFSRSVDKEFWHRTLPQLSHAEPSLWQAMIAMSCLIQYPQYSAAPTLPASPKNPVSNENHRRALTWYGQSLASLRDSLKPGPKPSSIAILLCIIYACIECLQDHVTEAIALYRNAVAMIGLAPPTDPEQRGKLGFETQLDSKIRAMLRHETMSHGLPVPRPNTLLDSSSGSFKNLVDAHEEQYVLITEAQTFIQQVVRTKEMHGKIWAVPAEMIIQQERHQTQMIRWQNAFNDTACSTSLMTTPDEVELRSVLHIAYMVYFIWLSACLSNHETAFDAYVPYFASILQHSERVILSKESKGRAAFVLETRVIPSLYFVAIKCRDPRIRRRAVSLLRRGPKVENTWKAEPMAHVAERSIDAEETGLLHGDPVANANPWPRDKLPPECNRLYRQEVVDLRRKTKDEPDHHLVLFGWREDETHEWSRMTKTIKYLPA